MIQNVLQHLGGIENYGILSICLFFLCFLGILAWALRLKKSYLDSAAALPLQNDREESKKQETSHE
jgi:cbb3-type cytochrome oxidase subunit 3